MSPHSRRDLPPAESELLPVRRFVDDDGIHWRVYEYRTTMYDRRRSTSLIFESMNVVRRVRTFPDDWFDLTDEKLAQLSRMR